MRNRLDTSFYVWDYRRLVSVKRSEYPLVKLGHYILSLVNSCRSVCAVFQLVDIYIFGFMLHLLTSSGLPTQVTIVHLETNCSHRNKLST